MLFLLPAVVSVLCDWRLDGGIVWSGYVVGGLLLLYVTAVLPLWFKRPNPVIFVPVDFIMLGLYLFYINFAVHGHWFLTFALPVTGAAMLLVTAMVALLRSCGRSTRWRCVRCWAPCCWSSPSASPCAAACTGSFSCNCKKVRHPPGCRTFFSAQNTP